MAGLAGIDALWRKLAQANPCGVKVFRVGVTLFDLTPASLICCSTTMPGGNAGNGHQQRSTDSLRSRGAPSSA